MDAATARTGVDALTSFLLTRYDELERVAVAAGDAKAYRDELGRRSIVLGDGTLIDVTDLAEHESMRRSGKSALLAVLEHAAWNRPATVLADIAAKRQIVELADFANEPGAWPVYLCALRALALPYADHPDYREEWKP